MLLDAEQTNAFAKGDQIELGDLRETLPTLIASYRSPWPWLLPSRTVAEILGILRTSTERLSFGL